MNVVEKVFNLHNLAGGWVSNLSHNRYRDDKYKLTHYYRKLLYSSLMSIFYFDDS